MQRIEREVDTVTFVANSRRAGVKLPQVEFLSEVWLDFSGTLTIAMGAGSAVLTQQGGFGLIAQAQLVLNGYLKLGNISPFTLSGYMLSILNRIDRPGYVDRFTTPVLAGANTWSFHLRMPITATDTNMSGILFSGMPASQMTVFITWADIPQAVTLAGGATATLTGQVAIRTVTFQVADGEGFDIFSLHALSSQVDAIAAAGVKSIVLPPGNLYLRIIHAVRNNSLYLNGYATQLQFEVQRYADPITLSEDRALALQRWRYLTDLPVGTYVFDYFWPRTLRDAIDTGGLNDVQSKITVGAVVGVADVETAIEQYVSIERPKRAA